MLWYPIILVAALTGMSLGSEMAQRAAPPSPLTCDRNHLTSFTGRVVSYRRQMGQMGQKGQNGRITLRVHTDDATTEDFSIRLGASEDGSKHFLMRGQPFKPSDWTLVEATRTRLRPKMRAIVWVCDDGSAPVIDWRPFEP
ncbi:MAG: hypothetical protein ABI882_08150 [Acidobacteriota bacterium]